MRLVPRKVRDRFRSHFAHRLPAVNAVALAGNASLASAVDYFTF